MAHIQSTDLNEYKWESFSDASCEVGFDVVYTYTNQTNVVVESFIGFDELCSQLYLVDHVGAPRINLDLDFFGDFVIDSDSPFTK